MVVILETDASTYGLSTNQSQVCFLAQQQKQRLDQGYSTLTPRGLKPAAFLFLSDNELHTTGVPGLNQSVIRGNDEEMVWNWFRGPELNMRGHSPL